MELLGFNTSGTYLVYGITDCPACLRACADLMDNEQQYVFINCDFSPDYRKHIRDILEWPTFPIVVSLSPDKKLNVIGGYEQLREYLKEPR